MKKILIFGSTGMIGHMIYNYLETLNNYELFSFANNKKISENTHLFDVRNNEEIKRYLEDIKPDYVINCAGLLIHDSKDRIEDAILINSLFPNVLSRLGNELNYKLIQISTDCVFSGNDGNYSEDSIPDGNSVYARVKALGEINNKKDLTIRTSTIGPELNVNGHGLLHWFLQQKGTIIGFDKAYWSGVTTLELAKGIDEFITQDITGIYNFTSKNKISKYDLLLIFKKIWKKADLIIKADSNHKNDKSLCNIRNDFEFNIKGYEDMLVDSYNWMLNNKNIYQHYNL
ncbi:MAG: SDR family oxidoreductase [Desulfobacterales bacterium]|nr:SDR family oxidoreductase [Desulfobacterales bacterium]